jgi:predicted peptidase
MTTFRCWVSGLPMLLLCLALQSQAQTAKAPEITGEFTHTSTRQHSLKYIVHLPEGYDANSDKKWPVLLFLHGAGERGTDVQKVTVHGPPKLRKLGKDLPFIIVSPQCPTDETWQSEPLLGLLDHVLEAYQADRQRVYLTGLSMGGFGSWGLLARHPDRFAAVAPVCGGGQIIDILLGGSRMPRLREIPVWAFHGAKDNVVLPEESERMVRSLKRIGNSKVELTIYPEADHDSWTETYNNPKFYDWLLQHKLEKP